MAAREAVVGTREAAVGWASRAARRLGFSALTTAYLVLDRCFLGGALRLASPPWPASLSLPMSRRRARWSSTSSSALPPAMETTIRTVRVRGEDSAADGAAGVVGVGLRDLVQQR
jgi:hypothetical protein